MIRQSSGVVVVVIPTIRDRVTQTAAKIVIEPIFEAYFEDNAYGYRPARGAVDAVIFRASNARPRARTLQAMRASCQRDRQHVCDAAASWPPPDIGPTVRALHHFSECLQFPQSKTLPYPDYICVVPLLHATERAVCTGAVLNAEN